METISIGDLDPSQSLSVDVWDTCAFLKSVTMRGEGSDGEDGGMADRFVYLARVSEQLGISVVPLTVRLGGGSFKAILLGDFLMLMSGACREGNLEAAHLDMFEDLHALERGLSLDEDEHADVALDLSSFVGALEDKGIFDFLFVDPICAELIRVEDELWGEVSGILVDHGRDGMSEETAMWVVRKYLGEDLEASDEELRYAVRVCLQDLDPVYAPEDYTMLSYIEASLGDVEDECLRRRMKEIVDYPENVHRMQEAFDEAGLGDEGRALLRASMELFAREWLNRQGIAWR